MGSLTRLLVNLFSLAVLVAILASPMILASNTTSEGVPWTISSGLGQSNIVKSEIKNATKGSQEVVLNFTSLDFSADYKKVLTIFNVTNSTIQVEIEKVDETNVDLNFESGEKIVQLKPGEAKNIDLKLEAGATSSKSTAHFIFKSL